MNTKLVRTVGLTLLLAATWILWSGFFKTLLLSLGVVSCVLTVWLSTRMGYFDRETYFLKLRLGLPFYWLWLLKEIVVSSFTVARIVISPRMPIDPQVVEVDAKALETVDVATFANSITLTPGTLTMDVHEGRLLVHTLTRAGADDLRGGEMYRRVAALRGG